MFDPYREYSMDAPLTYLLKLCILLLFLTSAAQAGAPNFEVKLEDAAPGEIKAIYQDKKGFMWFGGRNALLRYNAYEFQTIQAVEQDAGKIKKVNPYFVTDIMTDSSGTLWVATLRGLYIFNYDNEVLVRPVAQDGSLDPLFLGQLQDIHELPNGQMIIGTDGAGIALFDKHTRQITWRQPDITPTETDEFAVLNRAVRTILVDSQQRIWISTARGLNQFDPVSKSLSLYVPNPNSPATKEDNAIITMAEDKSGNIIGGTFGGGLYIFDTQKHTFRRFRNNPQDPTSLPDDAVWQVLMTSSGRIWLGLGRGGVTQFNAEQGTFTRFNYVYGTPGAPAYGATIALYEDNNKNIWAGHYPGMVSFHDHSSEAISVYRKSNEVAKGISDNNILALVEDPHKNLWLAVGEGVDYFNRKADTFKYYNNRLGNYPASGTLSAYLDRQAVLWVGTWMEGFSRFNKTADRFEVMPFSAALANADETSGEQLNDSIIWGYCEDKNNDLWVGTHYAGISRYDAEQKRFTKYKNDGTEGGLANNIAWTCYEDSKGRFWVGTSDGLSLKNTGAETFKNYRREEGNNNSLRSGSVLDIYEDSKHRLWFATDNGLHLYREDSDDFEVFTADNGFINSGIRALTGDRLGNLWLGTNNGIVRFNPDTLDVKNYLYFAGKKCGAVNTGAALTSSNGEVMFGTTDGLIIIDAEKLTTNEQQLPVVLTDFKVFAKSVTVGEPGGLLKKVVNNTDKIVLDYTKKMFSFEFALLNYRSAYKNTYAYMLEGFDRGWREVGIAREAQYTNLSPGTYVFKVRAANNDGVWTTEPKSIVVEQMPPPWKTWWAYTFYAVLIAASIAYFVFLQKLKQRKVEEQNRLLEFKVLERTRDLAQKNKDIQTLLANMRQGLLAIEEGAVIHHEYSTHLESIFETQAIEGRDVIDFLFGNALLDDDVICQMRSSINSMIGEDEMNYAMNAHILIREYQLRVGEQVKTLSLDWSPILDADDNVVRLMVSIRDSTELKALEREAGVKKRELEIIGQLLPISTKKFTDYLDSSERYIKECLALLTQLNTPDGVLLGKLFRNMHTLKGNSRNYRFSYVTNAAHEAETFFEQARNLPADQLRSKLTAELESVGAVINDYKRVYHTLMAHNEPASGHGSGLWISREAIADIKLNAEQIGALVPASSQSILNIIEKTCAAALGEVIAPVVDALPDIAQSLGKNAPQVIIADAGILLKEAVHERLRAVFMHLLRNSLDHGIEPEAARLVSHKDPVGTITIDVSLLNNHVVILLRDDGRGLNLHRLYQKGVEAGLWDAASVSSLATIANSIFNAGVSTKQTLDHISGRGVGLDAVKQFLIEIGGDISVEIIDADGEFAKTIQREGVSCAFKITLPITYCVA